MTVDNCWKITRHCCKRVLNSFLSFYFKKYKRFLLWVTFESIKAQIVLKGHEYVVNFIPFELIIIFILARFSEKMCNRLHFVSFCLSRVLKPWSSTKRKLEFVNQKIFWDTELIIGVNLKLWEAWKLLGSHIKTNFQMDSWKSLKILISNRRLRVWKYAYFG